MNNFLVAALVGVVVVGGGYVLLRDKDASIMEAQDSPMTETVASAQKMEQKEGMSDASLTSVETDNSMSADESKMEGDLAAMAEMEPSTKAEAGNYLVYAEEKLAMAQTGKVVLFFKAGWCPSCRALDSDIKAKVTTIPTGLTILEVDYDTATALKQKYGVTTQHTLVQVDEKGTLLKKWSGGATLASISAEVQ
ncbi:thioredoxin family protein [Patescibacteria group bacterium]|nr:thioredoxin family protein [Patescibacteria group bacterium]